MFALVSKISFSPVYCSRCCCCCFCVHVWNQWVWINNVPMEARHFNIMFASIFRKKCKARHFSIMFSSIGHIKTVKLHAEKFTLSLDFVVLFSNYFGLFSLSLSSFHYHSLQWFTRLLSWHHKRSKRIFLFSSLWNIGIHSFFVCCFGTPFSKFISHNIQVYSYFIICEKWTMK